VHRPFISTHAAPYVREGIWVEHQYRTTALSALFRIKPHRYRRINLFRLQWIPARGPVVQDLTGVGYVPLPGTELSRCWHRTTVATVTTSLANYVCQSLSVTPSLLCQYQWQCPIIVSNAHSPVPVSMTVTDYCQWSPFSCASINDSVRSLSVTPSLLCQYQWQWPIIVSKAHSPVPVSKTVTCHCQ